VTLKVLQSKRAAKGGGGKGLGLKGGGKKTERDHCGHNSHNPGNPQASKSTSIKIKFLVQKGGGRGGRGGGNKRWEGEKG